MSARMALAFLACVSVAGVASADPRSGLIREVEALRNSLSYQDSGRPALTLKLADLIFDELTALNRAANPAPEQADQVERYRKRALALYAEALSGANGVFSPPSGSLKTKIQFQLARLNADLGRAQEARPLWEAIAAQTELPQLRREAVLRLAELHESDSTAAADRYYRQAIELCPQGDSCYYAHYRLAWLLHRQGRHEEAIRELQLSLWDSKGQAREEALRDLLLFLSQAPGDGQSALVAIEELSQKLARPGLLVELADAFYAAGNKPAGTRVLEYANGKRPELRHHIRLLEEYYGARRWNDFRGLLERVREEVAQSGSSVSASTDASIAAETEKILRRLTIQLDGERLSRKELASDFKSTVLLYLALFPRTQYRARMIDGWLAAEEDPQAKLAQLKTWIAEASTLEASLREASGAEELRLREIRAAVAQKVSDFASVTEEMQALAARGGPRIREYRYQAARALYGQKKLDQALPIFQELAWAGTDKWAVLSQNLALDIYNQRKQYDELIRQAESWTESSKHQAIPALAEELKSLKAIAEQAAFERASATSAAIGSEESPETALKSALATFRGFCVRGKFKPKSCENLRVLALRLKDPDALIDALQASGAQAELAAEYEAGGRFAEAARTLESLEKVPSPGVPSRARFRLKLALLYELGERTDERNRVLRELVLAQKAAKKPLPAEEEALLIQTLHDTGLIDLGFLSAALSPRGKARVASALLSAGKGGEAARRILLDSTEDLGPQWSQLVIAEVERLDREQRKQGFYGKNSKALFERRLAGLKKLVSAGERYLPGARPAIRAKLARILAESHRQLASEIVSGPLPRELDAAQAEQVRASLKELAAPIEGKASQYEEIAREQLAKAGDSDVIVEKSAAAPLKEVSEAKLEPAASKAAALLALRRDPSSREALEALRSHYESHGQARLAAYFQGRLSSLESRDSAGEEASGASLKEASGASLKEASGASEKGAGT